MVYNLRSSTRGNKFACIGIKNENILGKELAEELHKPVIGKFEKLKVHSSFIDNVWSIDYADMQLISESKAAVFWKYAANLQENTKDIKEWDFLCVIDIFSEYLWFIPLKVKREITITNAFQKILDESNRISNKIWIDKDSNFTTGQRNHGYKEE